MNVSYAFTNKIIPKAGLVTYNFVRCPFQPTAGQINSTPHFWGSDWTGNFWGLGGYYGSVPCWRKNSTGAFVCYQSYTFTVNATGWFDQDRRLTNPATYSAVVNASNPALTGLNTCPGLYGLYHSSQTLTTNNAIIVSNQMSNYSPLGFANIKEPFVTNVSYTPVPYLSGSYSVYSYVNSAFTIIDYLGREYLVAGSVENLCYDSRQTGILHSYGAWSQSALVKPYNPASPVTLQINTIGLTKSNLNYAINALSSSSGPSGSTQIATNFAKINPVTGAFICNAIIYSPGRVGNDWFCGKNISTIYAPGQLIQNNGVFEMSTLTLSSASDQADLKSYCGGIQQMPGGGFILWGTYNPGYFTKFVAFIVSADLSYYYRLEIALNLPQFENGPFDLGVDLNGFIYIISRASNVVTALYWTGASVRDIVFINPVLNMMGANCREDDCNPW